MVVRRNRSPRDQRGRLEPLGPRSAAEAWMSPNIDSFLFSRLKPNELFQSCGSQERKFKSIDGKAFLQSLDRMLLFGGPVFSDGPASRKKNGYPLDITIKRPRGAESEWRYMALLKALKKLDETDHRWLLIARWLESECICQAEAFLPREILERLHEIASKTRMRVSPTDLQKARLIGIWLPYFRKLLADAKKARKARRGPVDALLKMGYVRNAVESTLGKTSEIHATASWLALRDDDGPEDGRKRMKERTLENAYSKVNVAKREFDNKFFKGIKRHPREIDPSEYHNFLHLIS
jgi:hypothetical protein